jgi:mannose/fructose/N-acetylgalactosamine-specific phosphotransferase system component IID
MYIAAIAWAYVVMMMAVAEATAPNGSVLGALITALLYGVLPISILVYLMRTPARKAKRRALEAAEGAQNQATPDAELGTVKTLEATIPEATKPEIPAAQATAEPSANQPAATQPTALPVTAPVTAPTHP